MQEGHGEGLVLQKSEAGGHCAALVGPAGGLSEREKAAAATYGLAPIALSGNRLRTETAAMAWSAWWAAGSLQWGGSEGGD